MKFVSNDGGSSYNLCHCATNVSSHFTTATDALSLQFGATLRSPTWISGAVKHTQNSSNTSTRRVASTTRYDKSLRAIATPDNGSVAMGRRPGAQHRCSTIRAQRPTPFLLRHWVRARAVHTLSSRTTTMASGKVFVQSRHDVRCVLCLRATSDSPNLTFGSRAQTMMVSRVCGSGTSCTRHCGGKLYLYSVVYTSVFFQTADIIGHLYFIQSSLTRIVRPLPLRDRGLVRADPKLASCKPRYPKLVVNAGTVLSSSVVLSSTGYERYQPLLAASLLLPSGFLTPRPLSSKCTPSLGYPPCCL